MTHDSHDLLAALTHDQDALLAESDHVHRVRRRVLEPSFTPRPSRWWALAVAGGLAAPVGAGAVVLAGLGATLLLMPSSLSATLDGSPVQVGAWLDAREAHTLRFSDGSEVALDVDSQLRVNALGPAGASLQLDRGSATFDIVHTGHSEWLVDAGPYEVHVVGTAFDLGWEPERGRLTVQMRDGKVVIDGPMLPGGFSLSSEQHLEAWVRDQRVEFAEHPPVDAVAPVAASPAPPVVVDTPEVAVAPVEHVAPAPPAAAPSEEGPTWQGLAHEGRYVDAIAHVAPDVVSSATEADLILLGDAARFADDHALARRAYAAVRERFAGGDAAAHAAFQLGRLEIDRAGNLDAGSKWLQLYVSERPDGPLAEQAMGRVIEAESQAGRKKEAATWARTYLVRFPRGAHATYARKLAKGR